MLRRAWRRLLVNLRRGRLERDLDDEIRFHLEQEAASLRRTGVDADAARAAARKAFGGVERAKDASRRIRGVAFGDDLRQDLRYARRTIRRNPWLAAAIVATMAVAIAANAGIFTVVYGVLLEPLPFPSAGRLVVISERTATRPDMAVAYPDFLDWQARQHVFEDMAAQIVIGGVLTGGGEPSRVFGRAVTHSFFSTLQVTLPYGRVFTPAEDSPGGPRVAVLGYGLWQRRYGGNTALVGNPIIYNGVPYTVVGIMPADFDYYGRADANNDLFLPLGQDANEHYMTTREAHPVRVVARLRDGVRVDRAQADLSVIAAAIAAEHRETNDGVSARVRPLLDDYVGDVRPALTVLLGAAGLVLAIACANIANILLARATGRRREIAMRLALGAGRGRIVRQLLTETLLLAFIGGGCGLVLAKWAIGYLPALAPDALPRIDEIAMNWRVAAAACVLTALAGVAFGVLPALTSGRLDVQEALKGGGRTHVRGRDAVRQGLVVAQVAVSVCLLFAAGLLLRSFDALRAVDPGYRPEHVVTMRLRLPDARYADRQRVLTFLDSFLARVTSRPEVERACLTTGVPLGRANEEHFTITGRAVRTTVQQPVALTQWVTPDYYATLGIPLVAGRYFTDADREGAANVAIVDEEFVRREFQTPEQAMGAEVRIVSEGDRPRHIVGIVRHVRHAGLDEQPQGELYAPYAQMEPGWQLEIGRAMDVAVRSAADPALVIAGVREAAQSLDAELPLSHVRTMTDAVAASLAPRVFSLSLIAVFAGVAIFLCVLGVYGVMSYAVAQQTRDIGVRLALGAQPARVLSAILRHALIMVLAGAALGAGGGLAAGRFLSGLVYGVTPRDLLTLATAAVFLSVVALVASFVPARRALRIDPLLALRDE